MAKKILPRGVRNNNPLNIRKGNNWKGERPHQTDKAFEEFESLEYGFRAALKLIKRYIKGTSAAGRKLDTIEKIVSRWAPEIENATQKYIDYVCGCVGIHKNEKISWEDRNTICRIVQAMAVVECGQTFDIDIIQSAYDMV